MFAKVILRGAHTQIDRVFDYRVPEGMTESMREGMRVIVPFGSRNTRTEGFVMAVSSNTRVPENRLKAVLSIVDDKPVFSREMLSVAKWMQEKYYTTLSQCLQTIMPAGVEVKLGWVVILNEDAENMPKEGQSEKIVSFLRENGGEALQSQLYDVFGKSVYPVLKKMNQEKILTFRQQNKKKDFLNLKKMVCLGEQRDNLILALKMDKRKQSQLKVLEYLKQRGGKIEKGLLKNELGISESPLVSLEKSGLIFVEEAEERRGSYDGGSFCADKPISLNEDQKEALRALEEELGRREKKPVLLHGITGSGKTEIYLRLIDEVIQNGQEAIVLVPEISLTPQTVGRFTARFGNRVSVTHSRMSQAERYDQWKKARDGEVSVMIGPRSAVFAPFSHLGAIIIDEAHESSYLSETSPKYNAIEVAQKRCELTGGLLLLGSATPGIKTYYEAMQGNIRLLKLNKRAAEGALPSVTVKDMRVEMENGNRSVFSEELYRAIKENLEKGEQTILFLNRRGFSTFVSCRKCGHVMMCDRCNVSYTYHQKSNTLMCHYCGKTVENPKVCPKCGSRYIRYFGTGTQKIEAEVKRLFPEARVLRMDLDTTSKKHSFHEILEAFGKQQADILIGTQMIAKGHDFPNVTLVGILAADLSLNTGDYRAQEVTFQLVTQVAGRAGRGKKPGRVYIQTYNPENYSIIYAAAQDYEGFYAEEIRWRSMMNYPPFSNIATVLLTGENEKKVIDSVQRLSDICKKKNKEGLFQILGPTPAAVSKINNEYRWRILLKGDREEKLRGYLLDCIHAFESAERARDIYVNISMNPFHMV